MKNYKWTVTIQKTITEEIEVSVPLGTYPYDTAREAIIEKVRQIALRSKKGTHIKIQQASAEPDVFMYFDYDPTFIGCK